MKMLIELNLMMSALLGIAFANQAQSMPVTEVIDRVELNWSTMRIRFYGEAAPTSGQVDYDQAEKVATEEGLLYALQALPKIRSEKGLGSPVDNRIAAELTRQTYITNTTYFPDGRVQVDLEGNLPKALEPTDASFGLDEPQSEPSQATVIVLNLTQNAQPSLSPEIITDSGETLYSMRQIAQSAFRKNMTGRWYYQKSFELKSYSGANPVVLDAVPQGTRFVVDRAQWQKIASEHPRVIEEARIVFALPSPPKTKNSSRE